MTAHRVSATNKPEHVQAECDGGDLDCGSGLLLIIRNHMLPLNSNDVLLVKSRENSVKEDLPAWCRMVKHKMMHVEDVGNNHTHYFIAKKGDDAELTKDLETAKNFKWKTRLKWNGGMKATAYTRNHSFVVGQSASFDTEDEAPSAIEYLISALAGCLLVGFQWRLSQKNIEIYNLEITLHAEVDNILFFLGVQNVGHSGVNKITGQLYVDADEELSTLQTVWQETLERSPVANTLINKTELKIEMRQT